MYRPGKVSEARVLEYVFICREVRRLNRRRRELEAEISIGGNFETEFYEVKTRCKDTIEIKKMPVCD